MKLDEIEVQVYSATRALAEKFLTHDPSIRMAFDNGSDHVTINSSFLFRDKTSIKTDQAQERLVLKLVADDQGGVSAEW